MNKIYAGLAMIMSLAVNAWGDNAQLRLDSGVIIGSAENGINIYKGIPYAQPPVDGLRWKPPQPISWNGEREALDFALPCPQDTPESGAPNGGGVAGDTDEDCLYLNVWMPANAKNAPVMLWVHGGAGFLGAGSLSTYDGTSFAKEGIILVTINYRLGMLGQFAHPALTKTASENEPLANYQLMDVLAALKWVQRNGEALGADTNNVTLFGQSAGAVLVGAMLSVPSSKGLVHKAIVQSAVPLLGGHRSFSQAEKDGVRFANAVKLPGENATAKQLRELSVEQAISREARGPGFSNGSYVILDPLIRPYTTGEGYENGATLDIPLMVGSTKAEFFGPSVDALADAASHYGSAPVWHYFFTYVPKWREALMPKGPPHAAELPYTFNSLQVSNRGGGDNITDTDIAVAQRMHSCWVAFAKAKPDTKMNKLVCADGFEWLARTTNNNAIAVFDEYPMMDKAQPIIEKNAQEFPMLPGIGEPQS